MALGLLVVSGTLDVDQFWPKATSDADTTKVRVDVAPDCFRFRASPDAPSVVTHVFDNATVRGIGSRPAIENGQIRVRLQGVGAPELHYRPQAEVKKAEQTDQQHKLYLKWNFDYRQPLAETATVALAGRLGATGVRNCRVETAIDKPEEAFDSYGRVVGDVIVTVDGHDVNINTWLMESGWTFPSYYNSMSADEIAGLTSAANEAWAADRGVWPYLEDQLVASKFDWDLRFRGKGAAPNPAHDGGAVLNPKFFRRLSTWAVNKRAKMVTANLMGYLRKKKDLVHLTSEYLAQGSGAAPIYELVDLFGQGGWFEYWPEEVVYREKPSTIVLPGGAPVVW